jgi:hypothetical protein
VRKRKRGDKKMIYTVWCVKNEVYEIEADSAEEAIDEARYLCPFSPDIVEVEEGKLLDNDDE